MKHHVVLFALSLAALTAAAPNFKVEDGFLKARDVCFEREKMPAAYLAKFNNFDYPDEEAVHKYLHCVWGEMGFWSDGSGFEIEKIAELYKDRANAEVLVPVLSECNANAAKEAPLKWSYRSFMCIMRTQVGEWFREDLKKGLVPNGH